jgi:hypothetical protein
LAEKALDLDEFWGSYSSPTIFGVNELKAKRSTGHAAHIGGSRDRLDVERNIMWVLKLLDVRVLTPRKWLTTVSMRREL